MYTIDESISIIKEGKLEEVKDVVKKSTTYHLNSIYQKLSNENIELSEDLKVLIPTMREVMTGLEYTNWVSQWRELHMEIFKYEEKIVIEEKIDLGESYILELINILENNNIKESIKLFKNITEDQHINIMKTYINRNEDFNLQEEGTLWNNHMIVIKFYRDNLNLSKITNTLNSMLSYK